MGRILFTITLIMASLWSQSPKVEIGQAFYLQGMDITPVTLVDGANRCVLNIAAEDGKLTETNCLAMHVLDKRLFCIPSNNKCVDEKKIIELASKGEAKYTSLVKYDFAPQPLKESFADKKTVEKKKENKEPTHGESVFGAALGMGMALTACPKGGSHESAGGHAECIKYYPMDGTCKIKEWHKCAKCGNIYTKTYRGRF